MSVSIKFKKMHGLGNDFIIVDKSNLEVNYDMESLATKMANRNLGIGCDQFILYEEKDSHIEMEIYNPDGSRSGACGNATRCLAVLFGKDKPDLVIKVGKRQLKCNYIRSDYASVNMGPASFIADWMPTIEKLQSFVSTYLPSTQEPVCVDMGNPHLVIMDDSVTEEDMKILGPRFEQFFICGANINFARVAGDEIFLKVWERGTGFTLACGSGACATYAAARKSGFIVNKAMVNFKYGSLEMQQLGEDIIMSGPVTFVAEGKFYV